MKTHAARLVAVSEPEIREDSVIDITGTDLEREMLSMISEHTEMPNISPISFFEQSGSNSEDLLNANFDNIPRNNYGRHVLAVPSIQTEKLTRQIPTQTDITGNNPLTVIQGNGPFRPIPITPLVIRHEIPQPNYAHPYNGRGILQTPMIDQYNVPATRFHLPNLATQNIVQYPYNTNAEILQSNEPLNVAYYYNGNCQLYPDTQGTHSNLEMTDVGVARGDNATQQQRNPLHEGSLTIQLSHMFRGTVTGVVESTMKLL